MKLEGKSLKSDFLRFIIPSIIAQWVFSLYTMVDGIFVARGVSEVALTAVNISMPFTTGLFSLLCENIYWNNCTIFHGIYSLLFI